MGIRQNSTCGEDHLHGWWLAGGELRQEQMGGGFCPADHPEKTHLRGRPLIGANIHTICGENN